MKGSSRRLVLVLLLVIGASIRLWYAAYDLTEKRFWDERYNFENVQSILETRSLKPAKVYYPSPLVSWPQAGALAASDAFGRLTGLETLNIRSGEGFSPTAYLLCRLVSLVYGVASLWLLFLVGRELFDESTALLATLVLTFLPWHIHVSGKFKPDAFVVLTVLVAFYWSLLAIRRGSPRSYALAGFGIALALSGKLTGGVVAVPLVLGSLVAGWNERYRRIGLIALAGVTSVVAFLLMNPYGRWYLGFLSGLQRDYAMRAEWVEMTRWAIPLRAVGYLLSDFVHGPVAGALALAGGALLTLRLVWASGELLERARWSALLVFPPAFIAAYTVATPYFKGNNFLPMVPFTGLLAAWAVVEAWRRLGFARSGLRGGQLGAGLAACLVTLALFVPGWTYVYRSVVPTAIDVGRQQALRETRERTGRFFYLEESASGSPKWEGGRELARRYSGFLVAEDLSRLAPERLDLADAEIFPRGRLDGDAGEFYRRRMERAGEVWSRVVEPRLFRVRSTAAVVVLQPPLQDRRHEIEFRGRCKPGRNCFRFGLGEGEAAGTLVSLVVTVPTAALDPAQAEIGLDVSGRALDTVRVVTSGPTRGFLSERFPLPGLEIEVRLAGVEPRLLRRDLGFDLYGWSPEGAEGP